MASLFSQYQPHTPVDRRWLWGLRIATSIFLVALLVLVVLGLRGTRDPVAFLLMGLIPVGLYVAVLGGLLPNPPAKFFLGLVVALGSLWFVGFAVTGALETADAFQLMKTYGYWSKPTQGWLAVLQVPVLVSAVAGWLQTASGQRLRPWVWVLRVLAVISVLCAGAALVSDLKQFVRFGMLDWRGSIILLGGILVYGSVLWGLRRPSDSQIKTGLAVAVGASVTLFALFIAAAFPEVYQPSGESYRASSLLGTFLLWVLALTQAAYAGSGVKVYYLMKREPGDLRRLFAAFGTVVVCAVFWGYSTSYAIRREHQHAYPQASAVASLRTINTSEIAYASTYGGYSPNLAVLGPPPEGKPPTATAADLIDELLARGVKNRYHFTYKPGPPDAKGQITSYTVCAQPIERSEHLRRSFFTDESGVIRQTDENRCATAQDPPLGG